MPINRMPRMPLSGPPSARVWDRLADEVDALGRTVTLRRVRATNEAEAIYGVPQNVDFQIPWETVSGGNRGNWNPALSHIFTITEPGTYLLLLRLQFMQFYSSGTPTAGRRWGRIMLNGTSPLSNAIGEADKQAFVDLNPGALQPGTPVQVVTVRPLQAGDQLICGYRHSATTGIYALQKEWGGTYFSVARIGPGPGQLPADFGADLGIGAL